jgi:LCP family protein required for cell wall assembly
MTDSSPGPEEPGRVPAVDGRRLNGRRMAAVVGATLAVISLVTALSVVLVYRHLNQNLDVHDLSKAIGTKGIDQRKWPSPSGPINILVMGSDNRNAPGDHIDNLTGIGQRSDTTILIHLSADRSRAYGVSIPRDSIVNRPSCLDNSGKPVSAPAAGQMWNEAFDIGGPACTIRQFEALTHIPVNHWVVVDFAGFQSMVDAIGGVTVCLPHAIHDPIGHITLPAGRHTFTGMQALNYVRERHDLGDGSDIGRMKRQQAFIASMVHQVFSSHTVANPLHVYRFLEAATKSIHLDEGLGSLAKLAGLGYEFRHVGLSKIKFLTTPWELDPSNPNHLIWRPSATLLWKDLRLDKPLPKSLLAGSLNSRQIPGVTPQQTHFKGHPKATQADLANGLCA